MKKLRPLIVPGLLALLGLGAGPALADVSVTATIDKTKDVTIVEDLDIDKDVRINVEVGNDEEPLVLDFVAEADAVVNQRTQDNDVVHGEAVNATSLMDHSIRDNTGVTMTNEDAGNMSNQGNVLAVAGVFGPDGQLAHAQASAQQINGVFQLENLPNTVDKATCCGQDETVSATMDHSIRDNTGVTQTNQNAGNMSNQANLLALAFGEGVEVALAESDLGQFTTGNVVNETGVGFPDFDTIEHLATMDHSIRDNIGVTQSNQDVGNMANQGNIASFSAAFSDL